MSTRRIIESFDQWRRERRAMVLATVYDTLGSTYSKAGHRIVFSDDGSYSGLISGGCLEGDLAEHAQRVLESGSARPVTYDLRDDVDDVFGLGVGCNGLIRVFMQPLRPEEDYQPFTALRELYDGPQRRLCAMVIESDDGVGAGAVFVQLQDGSWQCLPAEADESRFAALLNEHAPEQSRSAARLQTIAGVNVLFAPIVPIPRLLILGAGHDCVPLVRMAAELGWHVEVVDHRPAYLDREDLSAADSARLVDPRDRAAILGPDCAFDAAVVMSHHLDTDAAYLRALGAQDLSYIGVLGPPARREKLLEKLEAEFPDLRRRLRGPIGLDIGGGSPEAIALSILAELQSQFSARD